LPLQEQQSLEL